MIKMLSLMCLSCGCSSFLYDTSITYPTYRTQYCLVSTIGTECFRQEYQCQERQNEVSYVADDAENLTEPCRPHVRD